MNLPLHVVSETATTITLGWDPVAGAEGYVFRTGNGVKSHTLDPTRKTVKFAKGFDPYSVTALGVLAAGTYPNVASPSFGQDLPARLTATTGSLRQATTLASLQAQITGAAAGETVRLTAPIDMNGRDLVLNTTKHLTVDLAAPVRNGRVLISRAADLRLKFVELANSPIDGIKLTDGSVRIDIDGRGGRIHNTARQGFLQTDTACHDWQVWNVRMDDCGTPANSNLDHANYIHDARGACVIGNVIVTSPQNYGFQFYSDCRDLICTGCEAHGTKNGRGGFVLGNEPGLTTSNVRVYGPIVSSAAQAMQLFKQAVNCKVFDGVSINNGKGFDPAFSPVNCITAQSPTAAKDHVQAARYGMHPTHDIDGKPFVTADAGARAL